jgi:glycosyltransferase involved in cell wall biosynthesis
MQILQTIQFPPHKQGGFEAYMVALSAAASERGHQMYFVFGAEPHPVVAQQLRQAGAEFTVIEDTTAHRLRALARLLQIVWRQKPHLVVGQFSPMDKYGVLAGAILRIPTIKAVRATTSQGQMKSRGRLALGYYRFRNWLAGRLASQLLAVSNAVKLDLSTQFGVPERKIAVIYNGTDVARYAPKDKASVSALRRSLGLLDHQPVVLTVAYARPEKRLDVFVRAAQQLLTRFPDVIFLHSGGGPLEENLKGLVQELGIEERVRFLGYRTDVPDLLSLCDVFVLPSQGDPCPRALIEAMASGCSIVASSVDGIPELLPDGHCGLLVPPGNAAALAQAIGQLLQNESLRQRFAQRAREAAVTRLDRRQQLQRELELYERVAGQRGSPDWNY